MTIKIPNSEYKNSLEPLSLVEAFTTNPPENFVIENTSLDQQGIFSFFADLDLFTTIDGAIKKYIDNLKSFPPFKFIVKKLFTPNVLFVGTVVSEYCLLPNNIDSKIFKNQLLQTFKGSKRQFLIIKDLPVNSPLLSESENLFSKELMLFLENNGFISLTGQALAYLPIDFSSMEGYLQKFSSNRRNNFRRKMKLGAKTLVKEIATGNEFFTDEMAEYLHKLYLNVYENSDIHFDKLTLSFFKKVLQNNSDGLVFVYYRQDKIIGFNLCYISRDCLVDKYRGSLYPDAQDFALFFNHFFDNVKFCLKNNLKTYVIGWTAPKAKAYLGCSFTYTHHLVYIKNPLIRVVLSKLKSSFEGDRILIDELKKEEQEA